MLVDSAAEHLTGKVAELALSRVHISCNKNAIAFDPEKPTARRASGAAPRRARARGYPSKWAN